MIAFRKVNEPFGWLSNMSPHPVLWARTSEALFQSMRFLPEYQFAIISEILSQKSPMGAKMVAKRHSHAMVVASRSQQDIDNMRQCLFLKVMCHPELGQKLIDTGDEQIVEDVSARPNESGLFWGGIPATGEGQNMLGKLWMEVRETLRK